MVAARVHLIRHGEVENPGGVLYARLPGFVLTAAGHRMAALAAQELLLRDRQITRLVSSPLERALQSAAPLADEFGIEIETDAGVIEASSKLEGGAYRMDLSVLGRPRAWRHLVNPFRPSWGEPFGAVAQRMRAAIDRLATSTESGDVAVVTHQLPIWMVHRVVARKPLFHDPRARRCALSSITTFERVDEQWREIGYWAPPRELSASSIDVGAV